MFFCAFLAPVLFALARGECKYYPEANEVVCHDVIPPTYFTGNRSLDKIAKLNVVRGRRN